jgi:hypothetical protein
VAKKTVLTSPTDEDGVPTDIVASNHFHQDLEADDADLPTQGK